MDYSETGVVKVVMKIRKNVLETFPEELRGMLDTPSVDHMSQIRGEEDAEFLEEDWYDMLNH